VSNFTWRRNTSRFSSSIRLRHPTALRMIECHFSPGRREPGIPRLSIAPNNRPHGTSSMCGRFTLDIPAETHLPDLRTVELSVIATRYNITPTQSVPVIRRYGDGQQHLDYLHWGLIPSWAQDKSIGSKMINTRSEGIGWRGDCGGHSHDRGRLSILWRRGDLLFRAILTEPGHRGYP
jgi:hypothetical protein